MENIAGKDPRFRTAFFPNPAGSQASSEPRQTHQSFSQGALKVSFQVVVPPGCTPRLNLSVWRLAWKVVQLIKPPSKSHAQL